MEHLCGYITLLNTGRESRTIFKHDEEEEEFNINSNNSNAFGSLTGSIHSSDSGNNILDEPLNGLKDTTSAAMLASEIDLLEQESTPKGDNSDIVAEKPNSLDLKEETESLVEDEWCLLDCYFGIPLFEPNINNQICEKIVFEGLFNSNRYVESIEEIMFYTSLDYFLVLYTVRGYHAGIFCRKGCF